MPTYSLPMESSPSGNTTTTPRLWWSPITTTAEPSSKNYGPVTITYIDNESGTPCVELTMMPTGGGPYLATAWRFMTRLLRRFEKVNGSRIGICSWKWEQSSSSTTTGRLTIWTDIMTMRLSLQ